VKIIDVVNDGLESVVTQKATPQAALARMEADANALMPK
jgi:ABC-type glycerol-3-phosphate transport system substrate-binding protein